MIDRAIKWRLAHKVHYTAIEKEPDFVQFLRQRFSDSYGTTGFKMKPIDTGKTRIQGPFGDWTITVRCVDIYKVMVPPASEAADLLIAHAVMDLLDLERVLPTLCGLVRSGGLLYLSLNYNGNTRFLPEQPGPFEAHAMRRYDISMDQRRIDGRPSGHSRTGRRLLTALAPLGLSLVAVGSSDWLVHPIDARYPDDDQFFLEVVVETICETLKDDTTIDQHALKKWQRIRRDQISSAGLIYMAHNLDLLIRTP
jgi:SAM-dependent methyltransferase